MSPHEVAAVVISCTALGLALAALALALTYFT